MDVSLKLRASKRVNHASLIVQCEGWTKRPKTDPEINAHAFPHLSLKHLIALS
jgi:hypothetical protein